jgi:hypothetical protein
LDLIGHLRSQLLPLSSDADLGPILRKMLDRLREKSGERRSSKSDHKKCSFRLFDLKKVIIRGSVETFFDFFIAFAGRFVLRLSPTFAEDS